MDISDFSSLRIAVSDLNGQMRGKRLPRHKAEKLDQGLRMPFSALNVDIWGHDIADSPLVFDSGDADGVLRLTERGLAPSPWLKTPSLLAPMTMTHENGQGFEGDPRQALAAVLARYSKRGWRVQAATEMEFTLVDDQDGLSHVRNPLTGRRLDSGAVLSVQEIDAFDDFFDALQDGCDAMGLPIDSIIAEAGIGQFEVTLSHQDAMRAADDAWLFKALLHGLARRYGMAGSFMAKINPDDAGNGMHVHFSVVDTNGRNLFDDGGPEGSDLLKNAVSGCLGAMPDSTLVFAPYPNSYTRLVPGAHAPVSAAWGYENRTAAIRIPGGPASARRIEHRSAGGDVNPYMLLSTILGAAMVGIEDGLSPPAPIKGNAYALDGQPKLAADLDAAISSFAESAWMKRIFSPTLIDNHVRLKRQESRTFAEIAPDQHWRTLLDTV